MSDTAADEYSTNLDTEALPGVGKPSHADRRAPQFGGMMKVVVVMLFVVAIGIAVYFLNTLAPIATAPAPAHIAPRKNGTDFHNWAFYAD